MVGAQLSKWAIESLVNGLQCTYSLSKSTLNCELWYCLSWCILSWQRHLKSCVCSFCTTGAISCRTGKVDPTYKLCSIVRDILLSLVLYHGLFAVHVYISWYMYIYPGTCIYIPVHVYISWYMYIYHGYCKLCLVMFKYLWWKEKINMI
jgi:hypothetical protein